MDTERENEVPEAQLLFRAKRGDLDAVEQIIMRYERRIFALALRLTGSPEDAKDATQETFIRLHRKIRQVDSSRSLSPWLYSVALNVCRDMGRGRRRARLVPMDSDNARTADPAADPECRYSDRERERHLRAALDQLPEKERAALLLREMEGMSTEEVAHILGSTPGTVRSQICTARVKLRRLFEALTGERS